MARSLPRRSRCMAGVNGIVDAGLVRGAGGGMGFPVEFGTGLMPASIAAAERGE